MPYRYHPPTPAKVADLRQAADDAAVVAPPADDVAEAPEAVQDVLDDSLDEDTLTIVEDKPKRTRRRKANA